MWTSVMTSGLEAHLSTLVLTLVHWLMAPWVTADGECRNGACNCCFRLFHRIEQPKVALQNACWLVADTRLVLAALRQRTSDALWQALAGGPPALHWQLRVGRLTGHRHAPGGRDLHRYMHIYCI